MQGRRDNRCVDRIIDRARFKLSENFIKELHYMLKI